MNSYKDLEIILEVPRVADVIPSAGSSDGSPVGTSSNSLESEPSQEAVAEVSSPVDDARALVALDASGDPALVGPPAGRRRPHPIDVFLARYPMPRSRQTMVEALERVTRIVDSTNPPGSRALLPREVEWHKFRFAHTSLIKAQLESKHAKSTVTLTMVALRGLLMVCRKEGLMSYPDWEDTAKDLGKCRGTENEPPGRALDPGELGKIVGFCQSQRGPYGAFLRGLLAMMLGAGLRATELCELPLEGAYAKQPDGTGRVRLKGKGSKIATQVLGTGEAEAIDDWLLKRAALEPRYPRLFLRVGKKGQLCIDRPMREATVYEICEEVAKESGVDRFMPHDLRRTYATKLFRAGYDLSTVQTLMRHRSPDTTRRYDRRGAVEADEKRLAVEMWPAKEPKP
jgi:integrase